MTSHRELERRASTTFVEATPPAIRDELGMGLVAIGPGVALCCRAGGLLFNRAIDVPADRLADAVRVYRERGIERFFVQFDDDLPAIEHAAASAGLARYPRAWVVLRRDAAPPPAVATDLEVGTAGAGDGEAAGRILAAAFDLPASLGAFVPALIGRDGWDVVVARDAGNVVGVGLTCFVDDIAYLAGGATAPAYRGRGAQGALMALRIERAIARGCRWITSETGEAVAGDPQHSFHNMIRCGFEVVARRHNYAPTTMVPAR